MSLQKIGQRAAPSSSLELPPDVEVGIPGSNRFALFYQESRQLPIVERAEGIFLWDKEGKKYLDGCSGAFTVNIGHRHPRITKRVNEQLKSVAFAYRTQFESSPAQELADLLVRLSPPELSRVFFVNSGSEAVETAVKLARQYWWSLGKQGKHLIISRKPSYHGATLGALSCTAYAPLNTPFYALQVHAPKVSAPFCYHCPLAQTYPDCSVACAHELEREIQLIGSDNVAAFIAEPIGGATTGAAVPPDEYFPIVERICHEYEVALIIDDVLTGCGRTGTFYGFEHWDFTPDLVAMSKGLAGGYTPLGACLATNEIVMPVLESGGFMHGHTYAGNPLSTAIAAEVVKVVLDEKLVENGRTLGTYFHERLRELRSVYPVIGDARGRGLLGGIEFVADPIARTPFPSHWWVAHEATELAREKGLLLYPRRSLYGLSGDHILLAPPLTIDKKELNTLLSLLEDTLVDLTLLLEQNVELKSPRPTQVPIHDRYHQVDDVPGYALGDIDEIEASEEANVTWSMQDAELEVQSPTTLEEIRPPLLVKKEK